MCITVGSIKTKFHVHKSLLCEQSDYFKAAFEGQFAEAKSEELTLEDEDPELFDRLLDWVYLQYLEPIAARDNEHAKELVKLWVLADKFLMHRLANEAINALYKGRPKDLKDIYNWVWQHTCEPSKLRSFLVERTRLKCYWPSAFQAENEPDFPPNMLFTVLRHTGESPESDPESAWDEIDLCDFHNHVEGERCGDK